MPVTHSFTMAGAQPTWKVTRDELGRHAGHVQSVQEVSAALRERPADLKVSVSKASRGKSHTPHDKAYKRNAHLVHVDKLQHILRCAAPELVCFARTAHCGGVVRHAGSTPRRGLHM